VIEEQCLLLFELGDHHVQIGHLLEFNGQVVLEVVEFVSLYIQIIFMIKDYIARLFHFH
jgi:hypothetical protein